jgi:4-hydroxybenzoate polyprenyltransferase
LPDAVFILLALSSLAIAAAGYVYNDIIDLKIDRINKPKRVLVKGTISVKTAKVLYYALTIIGLILAIVSAISVRCMALISIQLLVIVVLYLYSKFFKCGRIIGNLAIAFVLFLVPILIWIYTIYSLRYQGFDFQISLKWMNYSVLFFAFFAGLANLIREIIKDKEDSGADLACGCRTWAAQVSVTNLKITLIGLLLILILSIGFFQYIFPISIPFKLSFGIIILIILSLVVPKLIGSHKAKDFLYLSVLMKIIMVIGVLSPVLLWIR